MHAQFVNNDYVRSGSCQLKTKWSVKLLDQGSRYIVVVVIYVSTLYLLEHKRIR